MSETTGKKKQGFLSVKKRKKQSHWHCCMQASSICTSSQPQWPLEAQGGGEKKPLMRWKNFILSIK